MKEETIRHIEFDNKTNPKSYFEVVRLEELLTRELDHDICKNHIVHFYMIVFVSNGEGYHTIDFTDYKYQKGTILLIRKDQIQKFFKSPNVEGYLLIFTEEFVVSHLNKMEALKSLQLFNELLSFPKIEISPDQEEFSDFATLIRQVELESKYIDEYSIGITRSALHMIITKLFRVKSKKGELLKERKYLPEFLSFQEMVERDCFQYKQVKVYADKLGVSTKTLNTIVRAIVNKPAKTFIDEIVITQIKRLLLGTNMPVKEIAYTVGFEDPANFFKYFKKYVDASPEAYRQAHH
ncbi:helix-turn-helix domain-containing protein [Aquimarina sp. D1M17]|uniref:AraC family transcriptional regulator n=1 Tax=Aquimarina acroporae TaxID=2937283 RepID=UPI0020BD6DF0|nr:helix-turn-helix domain-containing protein [Aquimarina acroporae]MCK8523442.1 helix-turn-helix domain-containing protein [Aquimarina acroporae]